jgi:hypothetical protein
VGVELESLRTGMWFGEDADDAHDFVSGLLGWMLEGADVATRRRGLDALRVSLTAHETGGGVVYDSAAWIVTASRP